MRVSFPDYDYEKGGENDGWGEEEEDMVNGGVHNQLQLARLASGLVCEDNPHATVLRVAIRVLVLQQHGEQQQLVEWQRSCKRTNQ